VTQLGNYRFENDQTVFHVDIDHANVALYAFEKVNSQPLHIVETNAESAYTISGNLVLHTTESVPLSCE